MDRENLIADATLAQFRDQILSGNSITGAVAVSSVCSALAVTVLQMTLEIAGRKVPTEHLKALIESASQASSRLLAFADSDRAAYTAYRDAHKLPPGEERREIERSALRRAIETPLAAAREAASVIPLCQEAARLAHGAIIADVGGAALLLSSATRAILLSVEANLRALNDPGLSQTVGAECRDIREQAQQGAEQVLLTLGVSSR